MHETWKLQCITDFKKAFLVLKPKSTINIQYHLSFPFPVNLVLNVILLALKLKNFISC